MVGKIHSPTEEDTPVPAYGLYVGDHFIQPYGYSVYRSSGTKDWLIMCTNEGQGYVAFEDTLVTSGVRDIVLIPPGTMHQYGTVENSVWDFHWAHFIPRSYWGNWLHTIKVNCPITLIHIEEDAVWERIQKAFARGLANSLIFGPLADELALNGLEEVLLMLTRRVHEENKMNMDSRIEFILQYMEKHYTEQQSIKDLAAQVNLSPSRLSHLFKDQMGDSIMNTLIQLRLRRAARLLQFTDQKISDIAHEVGFESAYYFTRKFTVEFGMTPTEYRKSGKSKG